MGLYDFAMAHTGWTFAFTFTHLLFWLCVIGGQTSNGGVIGAQVYQYGYKDPNPTEPQSYAITPDWHIASGPSGSGAFPITFMLVTAVTYTYVSKFFHYTPATQA